MCSDKTKGVFLYRPGGKNQNSWRSCLCLKKTKPETQKTKTLPQHTWLGCALLFQLAKCGQSQGRAYSPDIPPPCSRTGMHKTASPPLYLGPRSGWSQGRVKDSHSFTLARPAHSKS